MNMLTATVLASVVSLVSLPPERAVSARIPTAGWITRIDASALTRFALPGCLELGEAPRFEFPGVSTAVRSRMGERLDFRIGIYASPEVAGAVLRQTMPEIPT